MTFLLLCVEIVVGSAAGGRMQFRFLTHPQVIVCARGEGEHCVAIVQVKDLIEAGVHFGHRASRWNPKMRPYIYGKRNLIHIIDLRETVRGMLRGHRFLAKTASTGALVLFVGTKRQAKEAVEREAARCGCLSSPERWLGGTLTNYRTIRDRLKRLQELEAMWLSAGENPGKVDLPAYIARHGERGRQARLDQGAGDRSHSRLQQKDGRHPRSRTGEDSTQPLGIREMNRLPEAIVVVDPKREHIAVKEAQRMGVATVALIDTDSDPTWSICRSQATTTVFARSS